MIIVLDVDDTIYKELDYVQSGFQVVSEYLELQFKIPSKEASVYMCSFLPNRRGRIFDEVLLHYGCYSPEIVQECLRIYRCHSPKIHLFPDVIRFLQRFSNNQKYLVTDGFPTVQRKKIQSLGLKQYKLFYYLTHIWGVEFEKPHPLAFQLICEREGVTPKQVVYFGDNQRKDFVGISPLGFKTVQILRGNYYKQEYAIEYKAMRTIKSFDEVTSDFLESLSVRI
jgi:putative hydrolase of the HAD superfamily